MKLSKEQKQELKDNGWDSVSNDYGDCSWISLEPQDGEVFHIVTELLGLTGEGNVDLLFVGYKEQEVEE